MLPIDIFLKYSLYVIKKILSQKSHFTSIFCRDPEVRSETFKAIGGFDEEIKVAEDYMFSKQIKPKKFGRINNIVYTPPRRFENKGVWYMLQLMLSSFFNKNNKDYFTSDQGYWK